MNRNKMISLIHVIQYPLETELELKNRTENPNIQLNHKLRILIKQNVVQMHTLVGTNRQTCIFVVYTDKLLECNTDIMK